MKPEDILKAYADLHHSIQSIMEYLKVPEELRNGSSPHLIIIEFIKQPQTSYKAISEHYQKHMEIHHPVEKLIQSDTLTDLLDGGVK